MCCPLFSRLSLLLVALALGTPVAAARAQFADGCCETCHQAPAACSCGATQPVVQTQLVPRQVVTYRDVAETTFRDECYTEQVPVTTTRQVTVDEGGYQMVWVAKPVTRQVSQTTMVTQSRTRRVPMQVMRRVPQVTTQMVPVQTVSHVPVAAPPMMAAAPMMSAPCCGGGSAPMLLPSAPVAPMTPQPIAPQPSAPPSAPGVERPVPMPTSMFVSPRTSPVSSAPFIPSPAALAASSIGQPQRLDPSIALLPPTGAPVDDAISATVDPAASANEGWQTIAPRRSRTAYDDAPDGIGSPTRTSSFDAVRPTTTAPASPTAAHAWRFQQASHRR